MGVGKIPLAVVWRLSRLGVSPRGCNFMGLSVSRRLAHGVALDNVLELIVILKRWDKDNSV